MRVALRDIALVTVGLLLTGVLPLVFWYFIFTNALWLPIAAIVTVYVYLVTRIVYEEVRNWQRKRRA